MDIQSILNASDSSDELDHHDFTAASCLDDKIDLEEILREHDDHDLMSDEDDDFAVSQLRPWTPPTMRTSSFSVRRHEGLKTTPSTPKSSHNADDWAVLQHILNDDDEEDWSASSSMEKYSRPTEVSAQKQQRSIDDLVQCSSDEDFSNSDGFVVQPKINADLASHLSEESVDTDAYHTYKGLAIEGSSNDVAASPPDITTMSTREEKEQLEASISPLLSPVKSSCSPSKKTNYLPLPNSEEVINVLISAQSQTDQTKENEELYRRSLHYAQNTERKLLKAGHREIVSPLMVKRRLKPKIELTARFSKQQAANKSTRQQKSDRLSTINGPRFNFSGIVENKSMSGISTSLLKHADPGATKVLCGLPTCLAFNSKFIAVGTQLGIILIFDLFEVLRQRLGAGSFDDSTAEQSSGSITSIDLSRNGEAVVAGYTTGNLVLWDTIRGVVLRTVNDAHPSPITSVRFMNDLKMVTVDAGGLVNKLTFTKNLIWSNYSVDLECLLDGTAGQILAMNVLPPYSTIKPIARPNSCSKALRNLTLIALSSERSSFAVAVEPKINVLHRWAKPPDDRTKVINGSVDVPLWQVYLPCLSWGWALVSGGGNVVMPVLARAWGCCLQLLCASFPTLDDSTSRAGEENIVHWPAFGVHNEIDTVAPIVALEWLNDRSLVLLTDSHEFTLVDTVMMTLVERLDFSATKLVYAEFSLSRSVVKNKTDKLLSGCCTTFQNSLRCSDDRIMVLCQNELRCISDVGARRRISALEGDGEWLEALAFALDHYENTVVSQEDRRRDPNARRDLSRHPEFSAAKSDDEEWIAKLLIRYLNLAVENAPEAFQTQTSPTSPQGPSARVDLSKSHFQMLAGVCVEFCVVTRRLDLLFGAIFRRFQHVGFLTVFLDVLEPYVLNDKLAYIAPEVMSLFVEHCKATNGIAAVERCLLHMDCTIMDFDSILILLRANKMYSAIFYVFNQGLDDYVSPLEILLDRIFSEADSGAAVLIRRRDGVLQSEFERLGYKAILYLQTCFNGKTFPQEELLEPEDRVVSMKLELLQFLVQKQFSPSSHVKNSVNPLPRIGQRSLPFPYMRIFLLVDPNGLLDTLASLLSSADTVLVVSRSASNSTDGWIDGGSEIQKKSTVPDKQEIASILASILIPHSSTSQTLSETKVFRSRGAVNAFLDFAAHYVIEGTVQVDQKTISMILTRVAAQYASAKEPHDRRLYQRKVMDILSALPRDSYDPDEILKVFNRSGMHRASLLLHQQVASSWHEVGLDDFELRSRHFLSAIDCYVGDDDPEFKKEVFEYVKKECSGVAHCAARKEGEIPKNLRESLYSRLSMLVRLDAIMAACLVAELFVDDLDRVIVALEASSGTESQFLFLRAIISGELNEADPVAGSVLNLSMEHHHKYLSLLAKMHPDMVYDYLSTHNNYRTDECLKLCEKYEIADASAYLLERLGNVSSALQLILQTLETRLMGLKRTVRGMAIEGIRQHASRPFSQRRSIHNSTSSLALPNKQERDADGVRRILIVALDLCERNSSTYSMPNDGASKFSKGELWFSVLDRLINAKGFLRLSKEQPEHANIMGVVLSELLRLTMQRMVSSVPLSDLVRKVTSDHSGSKIGELREMVEGLLATYGFELNVFKNAVTSFYEDLRSMRDCHLQIKQKGSSVQKLMNSSLDSTRRYPDTLVSLPEQSLQHGTILEIASNGNAYLADADRDSSSRRTETGLVDAIKRLRARRGAGFITQPNHQGAQMNMMTDTERMFRDHETEPVLHGNRVAGVLGAAEHKGRLMTFN